MFRRLAVSFVLCALCAACAGLPRDPEGTLKRVEGGRLRVGLVERPPWVVRTAGEPEGVEVELVRRLAAELRAEPEWRWGGEQQHMEALERFELDIVVGGITKKTAWSKYVGLTGPYAEVNSEKHVMAVPPGENGWLARVEEFLGRQRAEVNGLLQSEAAKGEGGAR